MRTNLPGRDKKKARLFPAGPVERELRIEL